MKRRVFNTLIGGALASPVVAQAQTAPGPRRVGAVGGDEALFVDLLDGLRALGWVEGRNLVLSRHPSSAPITVIDDLLALPVEVLFVTGPVRIRHALSRSKTIPIVGIDLESDPMAAGFVAGLARPGGNVTGIWQDFPEIAGKLVQTIKEVLPAMTRLAVLWDDRVGGLQLEATRVAAARLGIEVTASSIADEVTASAAIDRAAAQSAQALLVLTAPSIFAMRERIAALARRANLPSISLFPAYAAAGGMIGYGASLNALFRQAGSYVDKILRGWPPAQLPIERPSRFELIVNNRTARELNVVIPSGLLGAADEVIE